MKKLLLIPLLLLLINSFGQSNVNRAGPANTVGDQRLRAVKNFYVPVYADTTTANITSSTLSNNNIGEDSCGALIYTYDVDGYWIRRCFPSKHWERFTSGGQIAILPSCGLGNNGITTTGFITYDSTGSGGAVFDVKGGPYALCCDHQARLLHDTVIVIKTPIDSLNPAFVSIYLGASGVSIVTGTPNANPEVPQSRDSCALLLSYILFNGGETTPAFVATNNPFIIYDENYNTEAVLDSVFNVTVDTANTSFPIHLLHAMFINNYVQGNSFFEFKLPMTIDLNNYGALKFYLRENDASRVRLFITWFLDDQPQTLAVDPPIVQGLVGIYQTIVIPTSAWRILNTTNVNKIRIQIVNGGASGFYIDWKQLQSGIPLPANIFNGVQTINAIGNNVTQPTVTNPSGPTATINFGSPNEPAQTVYGNRLNFPAPYIPVKVNLSTMVDSLLALANIAGCPAGSFLFNIGGQWQCLNPSKDTIYARNLERLTPDGNGNDTLDVGSPFRDSSKVRFNTFASLNNFFFDFTQGLGDIFKINPNGANNAFITIDSARFEEGYSGTAIVAANNLTLTNDANVFTISGATQINAITVANWQAGSQIKLIFSGAPTVKNNTAGGAGTAPILLAGSVDYTAAANDVLSLVYDGANWHETARKTAATVTSQTLQQTFNTEVGGSVLTKIDSIQAGAFALRLFATGSQADLAIDNSSTGRGINITTTSGIGINVTTTSGTGLQSQGGVIAVSGTGTNIGVWGISNTASGVGLEGQVNATSAIPLRLAQNNSATNSVTTMIDLQRTVTGTGANGIGASMDMKIQDNVGSQLANQIIWKWTDATDATRTSQLLFAGTLNAAAGTLLVLNGNKSIQLTPITSAAASAITPVEGMMLFVSNTNGTFTSIGFWGYQNGAWHAF